MTTIAPPSLSFRLRRATLAGACAVLSATVPTGCGGGAAGTPEPVVVSPPPPPVVVDPEPDFSAVTAEVERHPVADMALIVGNADGVLLSYEKGAFSTSDTVRIASSSKLLTGLAVWSLVEDGVLSETDRAGELLDEWSGTDARADVTLADLMSFTSGLGTRVGEGTCAGDPRYTLSECVSEIHDGGLDFAPGEAFVYGPNHMQVAALMAERASGRALSDVLREDILGPAGASGDTGFGTSRNPRYSGGASATADDYARVLRALLAGELLADSETFQRERSSGARIEAQPAGLDAAALDWRYGFGFWVECDAVPFTRDCAREPTISSAGLFGFVPWIDTEAGYWGVIAMEEPGPNTESTELQQILQPMIADALR